MNWKPDGAGIRPSLILASGSPRRRELLDLLGWDYTVLKLDVDETASGTPHQMVDMLCERKARAACAAVSEGLVLAADTLVALGDEALGKPENAEDARRMLRLLSGKDHRVLTGVCMMDARSGRMEKRVDCTRVRFKALTDEEIEAYIGSGEPMDKAGAYAIQGGAGAFVAEIEGSYENVIGLPLQLLPAMRQQLVGKK